MMAVERLDKAELVRLAQAPELADAAWPDSFAAIGNPQLLTATKTAVLCSRQCPGEVILRLFDLARRLRTSDLTFIGGFHTPAERDFLHHLLPGSCRLIICPARRLEGMRVPAVWQKAIAAERMLLLSPFTGESQRRQSARLAERRNELVVALADQILLLHAAPASRTAVLVKQATQQGKSLLALPFV
jgi:predicted Rossmann fold nucleotide-binding protein DprA/Smf involved in DNA uptake